MEKRKRSLPKIFRHLSILHFVICQSKLISPPQCIIFRHTQRRTRRYRCAYLRRRAKILHCIGAHIKASSGEEGKYTKESSFNRHPTRKTSAHTVPRANIKIRIKTNHHFRTTKIAEKVTSDTRTTFKYFPLYWFCFYTGKPNASNEALFITVPPKYFFFTSGGFTLTAPPKITATAL